MFNTSFNHVNIFITVNGKQRHVMTEYGVFKLTVPATIQGVNNITVVYKGNANYKSISVMTTVKVL